MFQIKEDLRIHNTKLFVFQALVELVKEYNYEDITISMIIKKSGVGRTTFYRHFYSKDDILISKLKTNTIELLDEITSAYDLSVYYKDISEKIRFFFGYWDQHSDIIDIIIKLDKTQLLYTTWSAFLIDMFSVANIAISSNASKLYTVHFAIGGLTSLLIQWFQNNRKESIDFVSDHFFIPQYANKLYESEYKKIKM